MTMSNYNILTKVTHADGCGFSGHRYKFLVSYIVVMSAGKYYLVDSGYANRIGYLAPFKGHRYHQQEFRRIARNAMANTPRELFNKVHSSLRSVVERTFGAWKQRWGFIRDMPRYDLANVQVQLVSASIALHNYIRRNTGNPTTVHPICDEEEAKKIVNALPEV